MTLEQVRAALPPLLERLALPAQARQAVEGLAASPFLDETVPQYRSLADPRLSGIAAAWLDQELVARDADGFQRLTLFLAAACLARETYGRLGISDEVYFSTMGCFRRFLAETFHRPAAWRSTALSGAGGRSPASCSGWGPWNLNIV